jgi:hypothetical protein
VVLFVCRRERSERVIRIAEVAQVRDFRHADRGPHAADSSFLRSLSMILFQLQCLARFDVGFFF